MNERALFLKHLAQTSDIPLGLSIVGAEGCWLIDEDNRRYLDLIAGISVSVLGHQHPAVVEAVRHQAGRYMHTLVYGEYVLSPQVQLARRLAECLDTAHLFPDTEQGWRPALDTVYFTNSGSEATEGAMKLAKRFTGRFEIVAAKCAYHGSTQGAASLMWPTTFTQAYHPLLPGIRHIRFGVVEDLELITPRTACVIVEPVQAEAGVRLPPAGFLQGLRQRCDETGALLIFDEIQTGFGRTGTLWAFERYGVVPDVVLLAKALGGGMPLGAFIAPKHIMEALSFDPPLGHITTFGGHPVSCAAALASLDTILGDGLVGLVEEKARLFKERLVHVAIREVRQAGLLMAVELADFDTLRRVQLACLERGLITDWFLFDNCSLRLAPPLVISEAEIDFACTTLLEVLQSLGQ